MLNQYCLDEINETKWTKSKPWQRINVYFITNGGHRLDFGCKFFNNHPTKWLDKGKSPYEQPNVDVHWLRTQTECECSDLKFDIKVAFKQLQDLIEKSDKFTPKQITQGEADYLTESQLKTLLKGVTNCGDLKQMVDWLFDVSNHNIILQSVTRHGCPLEIEKLKYQQTNASAPNTPAATYKLHSIAPSDAYKLWRENIGSLVDQLNSGSLKDN